MKGIFYLILLLSVSNAFSQSLEQYAENLERLKTEANVKYAQQQIRVKKYAEENLLPISYKDSRGNWVLMVDVTPQGMPVYMTTDNVGASQTIGANQLQQGGSLGLNVTGENITVGVWDGGIVAPHIEFENRLLFSEGSALDDHATHVSGTIASGGTNNPNSKGMAPKAKIYAWDFNNDEPEALAVVKPDQSTLLLSNHSYGLITGWRFNNGWQWFGNSSVSTLEDYRFGFYSGRSSAWDNIMFNAPYYTMVKSAGNDRSDTGNGTIPADCNGGAGYDCLGDIAVCKNNIVVGAVAKQANYTGPQTIIMSSFSSWGPSDDGRIKPDLVAAGVNLVSTIATETNGYGSLSGTSMATPSVTGGLALLQDLHKQLTGNYMLSATLKALAIHTTKEAGPTPGPDYSFGWGLLDVEKAAKLILEKDGVNTIITEATLLNNEVFELPLTPGENQKITVTIAWTDPAGNPAVVSLDPTTPMLVNDLDIRIVDDGGTTQMPWKLNP
ncbi:MAG: S8 family serine peptidase, partial [Cyclobacteriaceae bacterium]|nr:S8 family serine peptidase [Cyclobacteriaceae bacterium]